MVRLDAAASRGWQAGALPRALLVALRRRMTFSGWVATLAGWYVTEIGRQPFIVYGLLRTADVVVESAGGDGRGRRWPPTSCSTCALIVAYVLVLKYMAEKPDAGAGDDAAERAATPRGSARSPVLTAHAMNTMTFDCCR